MNFFIIYRDSPSEAPKVETAETFAAGVEQLGKLGREKSGRALYLARVVLSGESVVELRLMPRVAEEKSENKIPPTSV